MTPRHALLAFCCLLLWDVAIPAVQAGNNQAEQELHAAESKEQKAAAPPTCTLSNEDYAVFTAVLEGLGQPEDPEEAWQKKEILVTDLTSAGEVKDNQWGGWGFRSNSKAAPSAATQADYKIESGFACPLVEGWGNSKLYRPFNHTELGKYFTKPPLPGHDGWQEFYKAHPHAAGFWTFSRPGFNSDHTEAVLYVTHSCGWLCGTGHLYFLTRESPSAKWTVKNRLFLWIS
jgi:hypothetical protein